MFVWLYDLFSLFLLYTLASVYNKKLYFIRLLGNIIIGINERSFILLLQGLCFPTFFNLFTFLLLLLGDPLPVLKSFS